MKNLFELEPAQYFLVTRVIARVIAIIILVSAYISIYWSDYPMLQKTKHLFRRLTLCKRKKRLLLHWYTPSRQIRCTHHEQAPLDTLRETQSKWIPDLLKSLEKYEVLLIISELSLHSVKDKEIMKEIITLYPELEKHYICNNFMTYHLQIEEGKKRVGLI